MKRPLLLLAGTLLILGSACKETPESGASEENPKTASIREWKAEDLRNMTGITAERGVVLNTEEDTEGYVLFEPPSGTTTFLINKSGDVVHTWKGTLNSMNSYLMPNGHLYRLERDEDFPTFAAGGQAGIIREYDWDGNLLWNYELANETELLHHDFEILPNGNILGISYEAITPEEALELGRNPEHLPKAGLWLDKVVEIKPVRPEGGEIVWEWHLKDHLVQDYDKTKRNYGNIAEHPRRIDLNFHSAEAGGDEMTQEQLEQMKKGGMFTSNATLENRGSDITHTNAIDYHADLDQIVLSMPGLCEIVIIDHSTSTEEARGTTGGRRGHGGDLLYRWGNPKNYGRGTADDQTLFFQHDSKWIPEGYPGAGHLMVYNNDIPDGKSKFSSAWEGLATAKPPEFAMTIGDVGNYSAVYELDPPVDETGAYILDDTGRFGPEGPVWSYTAPDTYSLYSPFVSGAHRLPNGHTLITEGMKGRFLEIDAEKQMVWEYRVPYVHDYRLPDGSVAQPTGPFIFGMFRSTLYPSDYEAFSGREIGPLPTQPEVFTPPPMPPSASSVPAPDQNDAQ